MYGHQNALIDVNSVDHNWWQPLITMLGYWILMDGSQKLGTLDMLVIWLTLMVYNAGY